MSSSSVFGDIGGIVGDSSPTSLRVNPTLIFSDLRFSLILLIILCATLGLVLQVIKGQVREVFGCSLHSFNL